MWKYEFCIALLQKLTQHGHMEVVTFDLKGFNCDVDQWKHPSCSDKTAGWGMLSSVACCQTKNSITWFPGLSFLSPGGIPNFTNKIRPELTWVHLSAWDTCDQSGSFIFSFSYISLFKNVISTKLGLWMKNTAWKPSCSTFHYHMFFGHMIMSD